MACIKKHDVYDVESRNETSILYAISGAKFSGTVRDVMEGPRCIHHEMMNDDDIECQDHGSKELNREVFDFRYILNFDCISTHSIFCVGFLEQNQLVPYRWSCS